MALYMLIALLLEVFKLDAAVHFVAVFVETSGK